MAFITVLNGKVERVYNGGKGVRVVEEFIKRDDTPGRSFYTAFFEEPHGLDVGAVGKFSGRLSVAVSTNDNRYVDVTINNTRFEADPNTVADAEEPF